MELTRIMNTVCMFVVVVEVDHPYFLHLKRCHHGTTSLSSWDSWNKS